MRGHLIDFMRTIALRLPIKQPIYEFGSMQVSEKQKKIANLRPYFPGKTYIGCDMREGPGVDLVTNLHNIDLPDNSAGTVLCIDTLEHVEYVREAVQEIYRVTKPEGIAVLVSVMNYQIHSHPFDYWRFTPEAFRSLLKPFPSSYVTFAGDARFPHTVIGIGYKAEGMEKQPFFAPFIKTLEKWRGRNHKVRGNLGIIKNERIKNAH